jgi:hypothetical protein
MSLRRAEYCHQEGIIVPINLPDLPQAVRAYLDTRVTVTVSALTPTGQVINPGETFTFSVTATNASAPNGGIALTNVRYQVSVVNASVARIRVPSTGTAIDAQGQPIAPNSEVGFFTFNPSGEDPSYLQIGETDSLSLTGRAGPSPAGGSTSIRARIQADPDINALFPRNENSTQGSRNVSVVGA